MERFEDHILAKIAMEKGFFSAQELREAYRELGARMAAGQIDDPSHALVPILIERGLITQGQIEETMRIARWLMGQQAGPAPAAPPPRPKAVPTPRAGTTAPPPKLVAKAPPAPESGNATFEPPPPRPPRVPPRVPEPVEEGMGTLDLPKQITKHPGLSDEEIALATDMTMIQPPRRPKLPAAPPKPAPAPAPAPKAPEPSSGPHSARLQTRPTETPPEVLEASKDPDYVFDDFVLVSELGKGGMGIVWKAWQNSLKRWVAVKFLNSTDETELKRFFQEAKTVLSLDHPNIARLFKLGKYEQMYYLVMEFIDGRALQHLLGQLDIRTAAAAIRDSAFALQTAHDQGIVHRDIKPQNIMMTAEGTVFVMDFGLARTATAESRHTVSGMVLGTPSFMSPEQAEGKFKLVDNRSDVCSLGSTLYALLAGRPPFVGRTVMDTLYKVVHTQPVPIANLNAHVPPELEKIVKCAMEKEPTKRYPSAKEMGEDLERFLKGEPVHGSAKPGRPKPPLPRRPRK